MSVSTSFFSQVRYYIVHLIVMLKAQDYNDEALEI